MQCDALAAHCNAQTCVQGYAGFVQFAQGGHVVLEQLLQHSKDFQVRALPVLSHQSSLHHT